jgi:hypothetical protein
MSDPTVNLFGQMYEQIVDVVGGSKNFQLVNPKEDWTWAPAPEGFISPEAYRIVGQVPLWSAVAQTSDNDLHKSYLQVLRMWNYFAVEDRIKEGEKLLTDAREKVTIGRQQANEGYTEYTNSLPAGTTGKAYDEWIAVFWQETFDANKAEFDTAMKMLAEVIQGKNMGLKDALNAASPPEDSALSKPGFVKANIGTAIEVRPNYIFPDPIVWADQLVAGTGGESLSIQLSSSVSSSALSKSWAGESTGFDTGFFAVYGNWGWRKMDLETENETVKVSITVKAYSKFDVKPDPSWYDSGLLRQLAQQDTWTPPFSTKGGGDMKPIFGKGGVLPLVLTSFITGYQPSIDITMSDATYSKHKEFWDAATGVRIGTFRFGASDGRPEETCSKNSDNNQFHVESTSTYPFVMGVTVANPIED